MLEACNSEVPGGAELGFCYGFILGSVESQKWGALIGILSVSDEGEFDTDKYDLLSSFALGSCIPPTVENGQVIDIVVRYLRSNPEVRHESARMLIQSALKKAFPC